MNEEGRKAGRAFCLTRQDVGHRLARPQSSDVQGHGQLLTSNASREAVAVVAPFLRMNNEYLDKDTQVNYAVVRGTTTISRNRGLWEDCARQLQDFHNGQGGLRRCKLQIGQARLEG